MKTPGGFVDHQGYTTDIITDVGPRLAEEQARQEQAVLPDVSAQGAAPQLAAAAQVSGQIQGPGHPGAGNLFDDYSGRELPARDQQMTRGQST